ncbi:hypothetical protein HDC92_002390 [Pedobacter sp. AK017]|uniref:PID-CTERM protein-sorting domain-containing protein n=1 Tax=Pedobacter sp. AK017 TaxID=2723073 RepID=UPI00160A59A7|nr:hypothetical protein [Pedobacter sp. AK017]MBB5438709.1 hypothetical protein [Pedobacter sp. AK017]
MKYPLVLILILLWTSLWAMQADDPGLPGDDPDLPVDGGVAALLLAGAAYGLRKINQQKNTRR